MSPDAATGTGRATRPVLASWRWWVALWAVSVPLVVTAGGEYTALAALLAAVGVHEFGHWVAAAAIGVRGRMAISPVMGVTLFEQPHDLEGGAGVVILAAGPAANLLSAAFLAASPDGWLPGRTAFVVMSVVIGVFNLLPVGVLDGGRILLALTAGEGAANDMARCMVHAGGTVFSVIAAALLRTTAPVTAITLVAAAVLSAVVHVEDWSSFVGRHGAVFVRRWVLLAATPAGVAAVLASSAVRSALG